MTRSCWPGTRRYWGGAPKSDTLRIRIIPEPLTQAAEYEAGQLSVVEVPVGETRRWEQTHAHELQRRPALRDLYVAINTTRGPLKDIRVRRALNHAVDVPTLLTTLFADRGVLCGRFPAPRDRRLRLDPGPLRLRPGQGQKLLAEAGYPNGFRSSCGGRNGPSWPGWPSRSSRVWPRSGSGPRSWSGTPPAPGRRYGTEKPTSS